MISSFDSADTAIEKTINTLCRKLVNAPAGSDEFMQTVEAIAKLRASQNPVIHQTQS